MNKILIIKLGAMGDVLRTTPILRVLKGNITWVTKKESIPLLLENKYINNLISYENTDKIKNKKFDLVLNLDDDYEACELLSKIKYNKLIGAYLDKDGNRKYTESASFWFDLSLISRFGKEKADELKKLNEKSYQEHLFQMIDKKFNDEEYIFNFKPKIVNEDIIGLEIRADKRWELKKWDKFKELAEKLKMKNYVVKIFEQKNIKDYINDINNCKIIVTPDTLTMHIALALKKKVIAFFGPTSATEIYGYGRLKKIVSKIDCQCCYKNKCDKKPNCMNLITLDEVYNTIKELK